MAKKCLAFAKKKIGKKNRLKYVLAKEKYRNIRILSSFIFESLAFESEFSDVYGNGI